MSLWIWNAHHTALIIVTLCYLVLQESEDEDDYEMCIDDGSEYPQYFFLIIITNILRIDCLIKKHTV